VEADDVHQEIMVHIVEQADYIAAKQDGEFLRKVCWRAAKAYASKEQNYRDLTDDTYYYTPEEARAALRSLIYTDDEISGLVGAKDDLTQCRISDNILSARLDASAGLAKLTDRYRDVLLRTLVYGLPARSAAERRMSYRAADALAIAMNSHLRTRG
jgi:DNA-directed RNA polymerase specialized sigma24 family protein